jgi:hypothetical protein
MQQPQANSAKGQSRIVAHAFRARRHGDTTLIKKNPHGLLKTQKTPDIVIIDGSETADAPAL